MKRFWFSLFTFAFLCVSFVAADTTTEFKGHDGPIQAVAFSHDGSMLATAGVDGTVKIWSYPAGKEIQVLKGASTLAVNTVAFNKDGSLVATGGADKIIRFWDPKSGKSVKELKGHTDGVHCVAFSPDGTRLASAGGGNDKSVRLWDVKDAKEIKNLGSHGKSAYCVAFNAAGTELASCGLDGVIKIWSVKDQKEIKSMPQPEMKIEPKKEEPKKDAKDKKDVKDKKKKDMGKKEEPFRDALTVVVFTADGKQVLSVGDDGFLRYWSVADGKENKKLGPIPGPKSGGWIYGLSLSKDGKNVAAAGYGGSLRVYNVETGKSVYASGKDERKYWITYCAAFTPDGKSVVTGQDKGVAKMTAVVK